MKKWKIVADSICDIREVDDLDASVAFESVPLIINIDNQSIIDDQDIDMEAYRKALKNSKQGASTACPAPDHYANAFRGAENVLCFCVSKNLSGSYNSAMLGKDLLLEENPELNIEIINTATAGSEMNIQVQKALDLANQGVSFEEMTSQIKEYGSKTDVLFILKNIDNLVRAGRGNKLMGQMVSLLNIFLIGQRTTDGLIELANKARGEKRALRTFMDELKAHHFNGKRIEIAHASNPSLAETLRTQIIEKYPDANISIIEMGGLCEFYAEQQGIIAGFETA